MFSALVTDVAERTGFVIDAGHFAITGTCAQSANPGKSGRPTASPTAAPKRLGHHRQPAVLPLDRHQERLPLRVVSGSKQGLGFY